mmetsp:Transcript_104733/g.186319  ORF Transcript_104733/g.186319 Transcript_104733/m.186319 type:complete len:330 (+) Transcript_104733:62-1051(+)
MVHWVMLIWGLLVLVLTSGSLKGCDIEDADDDSQVEANPCAGKKPKDSYFNNIDCSAGALEQAATNVTKGYTGDIDAVGRTPLTSSFQEAGLCPVNVHWHLGAEHLSVGEFDEYGTGPANDRRLYGIGHEEDARPGFRCHMYDASHPKFTTPYEWKHCHPSMMVGETYEIHWPHSKAGDCGTKWQYQTPFYDGVFCNDGIISLDPLNTFETIGVQSQVFTIVNDVSEDDNDYHYYADLFKGMIVGGPWGTDIATYTGSTTGTSRNNEVCSQYTPITWKVDRKCHLISASSFDKLCADMQKQNDDMELDLHAHGARELVADHLAANNHQL